MATWVFNIFKNRAFLGNLFQSWITLTVKKILLCLSVISCISEIWVIPEKVLQCIKFEDLAVRETQDILSNLNNIRCGNWIKWRVHRFIKPVVHIWSKTIWRLQILVIWSCFPSSILFYPGANHSFYQFLPWTSKNKSSSCSEAAPMATLTLMTGHT